MERKSYVKPVIENNELISSSFIAASKDVTIVGFTDIDNCFHMVASDLPNSGLTSDDIEDSQLAAYLSTDGKANGNSVCVYLTGPSDKFAGCETKFNQSKCAKAKITYAGQAADGTNLFKADFSDKCSLTTSYSCSSNSNH